VRVAWRNDWSDAEKPGAGTDSRDCFTGNWEVMTVPVNNVPKEDFICNGVPTADTAAYNNLKLKDSVFLGYHTDKNYESAYIKK
jgi:hypothetical protein